MVREQDVWVSQYRKGVVELAGLGLLAHERMYGSQLVDALAQHRGLAITAGTVYPLLSRLKKSGVIDAVWEESPVGPPRKYYALTATGTQALAQMRADWRDVSNALSAILKENDQ